VSPTRRLRDRIPIVRATLRSNQDLDDVMVRFFDGDPADDGVLFDAEMVPHIPARERFVVAVPYQPAGCGGRKLFVEAVALGDPVAPAVRTSRTRLRGDHACR
jgi:hypothetical protein